MRERENCYPGLVVLSDSSVLKIRYRLDEPINLGLFIATHMPSWDFSGNFRAYIENANASGGRRWLANRDRVGSVSDSHEKHALPARLCHLHIVCDDIR